MNPKLYAKPWITVHANSIDPLIPEYWANESILVLEEEMVFGNLVHQDFSPIVANAGDIVHTQKPSEFTAKRKIDSEDVTDQDVTETDIEVKLDQHIHVSFVIKDGQQSKSFKSLVERYLRPAMIAQARFVDQALAARAVDFFGNYAGGLGLLSSTTAHDHLVEVREELNKQKAYQAGRNLVLDAASEARMLETDLFISAERVGDGGRALREASLGRKFGLNTFMDLNSVSDYTSTAETTTTIDGAVAAGVTSFDTDATLTDGQYITVAGDMTPLLVDAVSGSGPYTITVNRATKEAIADAAVVTPYAPKAVDLAAGYAINWHGDIHIDGAGNSPAIGQLVAFGTGANRAEYVIMDATNTAGDDWDIVLDRPLEAAISDDDEVNLGPQGAINLAFHQNAIALVSRPLELPRAGTGARAAIAAHNGLAMRVVMTYDGKAQGTRVTVDSLFGTKTLDTDLGVVLLS